MDPSVQDGTMKFAQTRLATWLPRAVVLLGLLGAWVSVTLLRGHGGGWEPEPGSAGVLLRLCESPALPSVNCAEVVDSRWGAIDFAAGRQRLVVPVSLLGLGYFASVVIWLALLGSPVFWPRWVWGLALTAVGAGLFFTLVLLFVMFFVLRNWCPLCLVAHLLNGGIVAGTLSLWRVSRRFAPSGLFTLAIGRSAYPRVTYRRLAWNAVLGSTALLGLCWLAFDSIHEARRQWRKLYAVRDAIGELQSDPDFVLREYFAQPEVLLPPRSGTAADTPVDLAPPRLVIFTNFDCRGCACFENVRRTVIEAAFEGKVRAELRFAPSVAGDAMPERAGATRIAGTTLERRVERDTPPVASLAAEAAWLQGGEAAFERMSRLLFEHRHGVIDLRELARRTDLDEESFLNDVADARVAQRVLADMELARSLGIERPPAIFLDGRRVPELCVNSPVFWRAIARQPSWSDREVLHPSVAQASPWRENGP